MDDILELLESPDPQDRAQGIKALAQDGSHQALKYLAIVYKNETDPDLRQLAVKAGKYIKRKREEQAWQGEEGDYDEDYDEEPEEEEIEVSEGARKRAEGLIDSALDLDMRGDAKSKKKARESVFKAFEINPNLHFDEYYLGVAGEILGVPQADVSDYIGSSTSTDKRKRKNDGPVEGEVTWEMALIDLAIYWVVMAAILIVGMLISLQVLNQSIQEFYRAVESGEMGFSYESSGMDEFGFEYEEYGDSTFDMTGDALDPQVISQFVTGVGIIGSIIYGIIASFFYLIGLLFYYAILHFSATMFLAGDGTFRGLIHKLTNFITITTVIYTLLYAVVTVIYINSMFSMDIEALQTASSLMSLVGLLTFVGWIAWTFWFSKLIGENYEFGTGKGCATIIISYIVMFAMSCCFSIAMTQLIFSGMESMMMSGM